MFDNDPTQGEESFDLPRVSRRTTLGMFGASVAGLSAVGTASADGGFTIEDSGPNPGPVRKVEDGFYHSAPEFPPFTNFEGMKEDAKDPDTPFTPGDVERYLQPHGHPNLLNSERLVVDPDGEPAKWEEFSDASATATVSDGSPGRGQGGSEDRSNVEIEFDGLYPGYAYTVWVVHEPGWHRPLGGNDGSENYFRPDDDGEYTLEVTDRPNELTLPPGATEDDDETVPITEYPLHEIPGEFFFVVAYHYDDRVWGSQPGPYWVPQLVINQFED